MQHNAGILLILRDMLSKARIKFVQSLHERKHRLAHHLFVVEGNKMVAELIQSKIGIKTLFATEAWVWNSPISTIDSIEIVRITPDEMKKLSTHQSPQDVMAIALLPESTQQVEMDEHTLVIVLDTIQDPGNLGTILRIADWYGIDQVICSPGCADPYSPKVVQSSMGAVLRIRIVSGNPALLMQEYPANVYGAVMDGHSVYTHAPESGYLLIGNEGNGIHPELHSMITHPITIPRRGHAESLNAAVATGILCDAWARNQR